LPITAAVDSLSAMLAPDNLPGADIINRLPIEVRAVILACMNELAALELEGWRVALACLLAEFRLAEARAAGWRLQ
jgi:hypothetical protein